MSEKIYQEPSFDYVLIKVKKETVEEKGFYEAVRKAWKMDLGKANQIHYVFGVMDQVVREVYKVDNWYSSQEEGRIEFNGKKDEELTKKYDGDTIPECYRKKGMASPALYSMSFRVRKGVVEEETQSPSANNANSKVRIYAKSQKWAAMGIIDAYTKMYPHATVADINKAFPKEQFAKADGRGLLETWEDLEKFAKSTETDFDDKQLVDWNESNYFLTLTNGQKISFTVPMWTKEMFEKLLGYAKLYDIEMAQYEAGEKGFGKRGEYRLEYLNGYVPPKPEKSKTWLWILIAVIVLAAAAFIIFGGKKEVVKTVEVEKIVYVEKLEEIEERFNAAEFEVGSAELNTDACIVLHDLAWVMEQQPNIRIRIEGHTSAEGDPEFNQRLSQQRAQATVDYLVQKEHVDPSRLEAVGYGSSKLKNKANPQSPENRRTEIEVIK